MRPDEPDQRDRAPRALVVGPPARIEIAVADGRLARWREPQVERLGPHVDVIGAGRRTREIRADQERAVARHAVRMPSRCTRASFSITPSLPGSDGRDRDAQRPPSGTSRAVLDAVMRFANVSPL